MKQNLLLKTLIILTLGISYSFGWSWEKSEDTVKPVKKTNKISFSGALKYELQQLKLQEKKIDTQIKILKKNLKTITTSENNELENSITQFSVSPKIIVKTINYDLIIKRPVYKGLLLFYKSKNLFEQSNGGGNGGTSILSAIPATAESY